MIVTKLGYSAVTLYFSSMASATPASKNPMVRYVPPTSNMASIGSTAAM